MKDRVNPSLSAPVTTKYRKSLSRLAKTTYDVAPPSMFLRDVGLDGSDNAVLMARLLSKHSFQICHLADGNSPELTQNVRLLRDDIHAPDERREPWDPTANTNRK